MLMDLILDALLDTGKLLPFLLGAFMLVEWLEHHSDAMVKRTLAKVEKTEPLLGALLGCIPQCGFSVTAANLYSGGVISLGTLIAVFLATSDEAILILLGHPDQGGTILKLLGCKVIIALIAGYGIQLILKVTGHHTSRSLHDLCEDSHCGCEKHHGILMPALYHTGRLAIYIFLFNLVLNGVIEAIGIGRLSELLLGGTLLQPFLAAAIGMIPNCAASILITELYLTGSLSFASAIAGLSAGAGVGLAVLFRVKKNKVRCLQILGILYVISVGSGILLHLLGMG